jgi:HAD superfamily hydrolase (TIGR01490 family)
MSGGKLFIFDLDHTLVRENSSFAFCRFLYKSGVFTLRHLVLAFKYRLQFQTGRISIIELHEKVFETLLKGLSIESLQQSVEVFVGSFLIPSLYPPAFAALKFAQHTGAHTAILSSSPDFLVLSIARILGVSFAAGTVYGIDKDRRLCNISELMEGTTKAHFLRQIQQELQIERQDVSVYTDSHLDLPLLLQAGRCIAVNPNKKLKKIALSKHWSII